MANATNQRVILLQPDVLGNYHELLVGTDGRPLAPSTSGAGNTVTIPQSLQAQDFLSYLALQGKTFTFGTQAGSAINTTVTGQTSFVATTPTFLLDVPSGKTVIPLFMALAQAGSVAGGDITVIMGKDKIKRYSSGTTVVSALADRSGANTLPTSVLYINPTATAGVATRMMGLQIGPDVSPAEGVINEIVWTPAGALDYLDGPATWLVYTYAASTGPSWFYEFKIAEVDTIDLALA